MVQDEQPGDFLQLVWQICGIASSMAKWSMTEPLRFTLTSSPRLTPLTIAAVAPLEMGGGTEDFR